MLFFFRKKSRGRKRNQVLENNSPSIQIQHTNAQKSELIVVHRSWCQSSLNCSKPKLPAWTSTFQGWLYLLSACGVSCLLSVFVSVHLQCPVSAGQSVFLLSAVSVSCFCPLVVCLSCFCPLVVTRVSVPWQAVSFLPVASLSCIHSLSQCQPVLFRSAESQCPLSVPW